MILRTGNMFDWASEKPDVLLFCGNSSLTKDGRLVMGKGTALEVKQRFSGIDKKLGTLIGLFPYYGVTYVRDRNYNLDIGSFQTKSDWRKPSNLGLIQHSVEMLLDLAVHPVWLSKQIWMPFPGIGSGGLRREDVLPLLQPLPENVSVWEKQKG